MIKFSRPVTLIGFSLGARVIFKCLQQMAESGEGTCSFLFVCSCSSCCSIGKPDKDNSFAEGLIEKVVLLGAPISSKGDEWESARKVFILFRISIIF